MTLFDLHARLSDICKSIQSFSVPPPQLPIIDLSSSNEKDKNDRESLPGLKFLREEVKRDRELLHKCLREHGSRSSVPISTNAPYLIAVWDELVHSRQPVAIYRMFSHQSVDNERKDKARRKGTISREKKTLENSNREVKVDVVADNGARWVRVNTIKNTRLMMEFREIDSYLTSSDEAEDKLRLSSQNEFDNSVLKMGRDLLVAAKANPVSVPRSSPGLVTLDFGSSSTTITPNITLRLTRLNPSQDDFAEPRIEKTIQCLRDMGLDVQLGERPHSHLMSVPKPLAQPKLFEPTTNINLDLSALIALVSDITHSPLPQTEQEAHGRFDPPQSYLEWKKDRAKSRAHQNQPPNPAGCGVMDGEGDESTWENSGHHSRALAAQIIQEMQKGILEEILERVSAADVTLWTTREARHRCLQITSKIGGEREKRRADVLLGSAICSQTPLVPVPAHTSLFSNGSTLGGMLVSPVGTDDDVGVPGVDTFWTNSRYPSGFLPLVPVHVYPSILPETVADEDQRARSTFFGSLTRMCTGILSQRTDIASLSQVSAPSDSMPNSEDISAEVPPATPTSHPKLTVHTVASMLAGASRGHTTLTTNRSSVNAALTEMRRVCGRGECEPGTESVGKAALWILGPRSLSEGMRSA